jgi:hypothetical protein
MKTYTTLNVAFTMTNSKNEAVVIYKVQKDGTNRVFFRPTFKGNKISNTLWARLCEAKNLAKSFLNRPIN